MIIDIINNKGGTGKTTTCVNLSAALANSGYRVLLVDLDSQASASVSLGIKRSDLSPSIADVLFDGKSIGSIVRNSHGKNLSLVTGGMELANSDMIIANTNGWENILTECLEPEQENFDFIICDSPPSMSSVLVNALVASDFYIVPITPEYLALEGLLNLIGVIREIKSSMNIDVRLLGILFTMVNPSLKINRKITREIIGLVSEEYGEYVFKTKIVRSAMLSEAPAKSGTIFDYAPRSVGAKEYTVLAEEVIKRCGVGAP